MNNVIAKTVKTATDINSNPVIVDDVKSKVKDVIKTNAFDIIGLAVILSCFLLALDALKLIEVTWITLLNMIVSFVPFYIATMLLSENFYLKGTFKGKTCKKYEDAVKEYSKLANKMTGMQLEVMDTFCEEFNENALKRLQIKILKKAAISFEQFNDTIVDGKPNVPLKTLSKRELLLRYNKECTNIIIQAKNCKVKGINKTILLSSIHANDETDLGKDEKQLQSSNVRFTAILMAITMLAFSLVELKNISEWSIANAFFILFKVIWIGAKSYLQYFKGFTNIDTHLVSHIFRKTDVLKQFNYWCENKGICINKEIQSSTDK